MYTYRRSKLAKTKLIHVSFKCEALLYPWLMIKFIYATVFYTNFNKEEMLQKHVEIYFTKSCSISSLLLSFTAGCILTQFPNVYYILKPKKFTNNKTSFSLEKLVIFSNKH